jgi:plasmid maintenance system antidote protein VapI
LAVNFVYIFRVSRLMWINLQVRYDPKAIGKYENATPKG